LIVLHVRITISPVEFLIYGFHSIEIGIMPADSKKIDAPVCVIYGDNRREAMDQLDQLIDQ